MAEQPQEVPLWGRGRPRIIRTGGRGRPRKQYQTPPASEAGDDIPIEIVDDELEDDVFAGAVRQGSPVL